MPAKFGRACMVAEVPRGPWHFDGEIDLGFGGALRMAATIVTRDPIFDWVAYGGEITVKKDALSIIPRDGLRQRFYVILPDLANSAAAGRKLKIEFERDRVAAGQPMLLD